MKTLKEFIAEQAKETCDIKMHPWTMKHYVWKAPEPGKTVIRQAKRDGKYKLSVVKVHPSGHATIRLTNHSMSSQGFQELVQQHKWNSDHAEKTHGNDDLFKNH